MLRSTREPSPAHETGARLEDEKSCRPSPERSESRLLPLSEATPLCRCTSQRPIEIPADVVDVFRRAEELPGIARSAAAIGANVLWMQLGIINDEAAQIARDAGLEVVMDRCVKIEHARFFGGLNLVGMNTGVVTSRRRIG